MAVITIAAGGLARWVDCMGLYGCTGYGALKTLFTYIQLWPLGTIEVENSIKGTVKKLGSRNHLGNTNETYFPTLIS